MRSTRPRVGVLDLDIFGPSIPKLMGLDRAEEPNLTPGLPVHPLSGYCGHPNTVTTSWCPHPISKSWPAMHVHGIPPT